MTILDVTPIVFGIPISAFKRCTKCDEYKPVNAFSKCSRVVSGLAPQCKDCDHEYYVSNRRRIIERTGKWQKDNADKVRENHGRWRDENAEHYRQYHRDWRASKPELAAAASQRYGDTPQGKTNRRLMSHRRRARKHEAGGTCTASDLIAIRAAQTDKRGRLICWACGKPIKDAPHLDHWIPLAKGGANDAGNLHYMHAKCNQVKSAKMPTEMGRLL